MAKTPNIPDVEENIENQPHPKDNAQMLSQITRESIEEYAKSDLDALKTLEKIVAGDPAAKSLTKNEIERLMRRKLKNIKTISEPEIKAKLATIEEDIYAIAQTHVAEYAGLKKNQIVRQKSWFLDLSPVERKDFQDVTATLTLEQLRRATRSAQDMKSLYEDRTRANRLSRGVLQLRHNPGSILHTLSFIDPDRLGDAEKEMLREELDIFENSGKVSEELITLSLKSMDKADPDFQDDAKKLLETFLPTVSFSDLFNYKILSRRELEQVAQTAYDEMIDEIQDANPGAALPPAYDTTNPDRFQSSEFQNFFNDLLSGRWHVDITTFPVGTLENALLKDDASLKRLSRIITREVDTKIEEAREDVEGVKDIVEVHDRLDAMLYKGQKDKIVGNIEDIKTGNYIQFTDADGTVGLWKIDNDTHDTTAGKKGIVMSRMYLGKDASGNNVWEAGKSYGYPYSRFIENIDEQLASKKLATLTISSVLPPAPDNQEVLGLQTLDDFREKIDALDEAGKSHGWKRGDTFSVEVGKGKSEFVNIVDIDETTHEIRLRLFDDNHVVLGWDEFVVALEENSMGLRRIGNIASMPDFIQNGRVRDGSGADAMKQLSGLILHDGKPSLEVDKKKLPLWGFKHPKKPIYMEVEFNADGSIKVKQTKFSTLQEEAKEHDENDGPNPYKDELDRIDKMKKGKKKEQYEKGAKKERPFTLTYDSLTYQQLLQLLQNTGVTHPVPEQEEEENENGEKKKALNPVEAYEEELKMKNGEYMDDTVSNPSRWVSIGGLIHGFHGIKHHFEEKWKAKKELDGAEAFLALSKLNHNWEQTGMAHYAHTVGGIIEKKKEHIKHLKGKEMRIEIEHILGHSDDPIELLAAALAMVESTGTLYPDEQLSKFQWEKYIWFHKIAKAIGVNPRAEFQKCFTKVAEANEAAAHHPTEEELITRLFKAQQSNKYVQAIGGGAKFWGGAAKGKSEQSDKGGREVQEFSTGMGRADYIVSKFKSNEFEISAGAFPELLKKSTDADVMGIAFVLAASNAPNYVHTGTLDNIKKQLYTGVPFHGLAFMGSKASADIYKDALRVALEHRARMGLPGADAMLSEYKKIAKNLNGDPYKHNEDVYSGLWKFWKAHHKEIHPMMQGVDPVLQLAMTDGSVSPRDRDTASAYLSKFSGEVGKGYFMEKGLKSFKDNVEEYNTFHLESSFLYVQHDKHPTCLTLSAQLSTMSFDPLTKELSGKDREQVFRSQIIGFLDKLRNNPTYQNNPELQKKQFEITYKEIMKKLKQKMFPMTREHYEDSMRSKTFEFLTYLEPYGFDISYDALSKEVTDDAADKAYGFFKSGRWKVSHTPLVQDKIHNKFQKAFAANDDEYELKKAA